MSFQKEHIHSAKTVCLLVVLFIAVFPLSGGTAAELSGIEYRIKSGFIYHFARFTQWPTDSFEKEDSAIILCLAAAEPVAEILGSLGNKKIRERKIRVIPYEEAEDFPFCHILFVSREYEGMFPDIFQKVEKRAVLTIGESENFTRAGGMIHFFTDNDRLRFAVNPQAARRAGLRLSSQLLMSAEILGGDERIP